MDLETMIRIAAIGVGTTVYIGMYIPVFYVDRTTKRIVKDTTKILDFLTAYLAPQVSSSEDVKAFHQLARIR